MSNQTIQDIVNNKFARAMLGVRYAERLSLAQHETLSKFDDYNLSRGVSPSKRQAYLYALIEFGNFVEKPFEELTLDDIQRYLADLLRRGSSRRRWLSALAIRELCRFLCRRDLYRGFAYHVLWWIY